MAYRVVASPNRVVQGPPEGILVWTNAVQWLDGSVDEGRIEPPDVSVDGVYWERGLTSAEARELAAVFIECADQIDGWVVQR
jgi:hypothetical protein